MSGAQRVIGNLFLVGLTQIVLWTATLIFTIFQARWLGPAAFGELSIGISYCAVLMVVIDFGLSTQLARNVAKERQTIAALWATIIARVAIWGFVMLALSGIVRVLGYRSELANTVLILGGSLLFVGISSSIGAYLQGKEEFRRASIAAIAQRVGAAIVGIVLLVLGNGVEAIAWVLFGSAALNALIMCSLLRTERTFRVDPRASADLLRATLPLAAYWIAGSLYFNVDMVILERLAPAENVGWYAAAYRLFNAAAIVPALLCGTVLYPVLSRLALQSAGGLSRAVQRTSEALLICGVFVGLILFILPAQVVSVVYPRFDGSVEALRLLAPGLVALYINSVFAFTLLGLGLERRLLVMACTMAIVNPIANALLIPIYAQNAAAFLTSVTEVVLLVWLVVIVPRELRPWAALPALAKTAVAGFASGVVMSVLVGQPLIVTIVGGLCMYVLVLGALEVVPREDLRELVRLVREPRLAARSDASS